MKLTYNYIRESPGAHQNSQLDSTLLFISCKTTEQKCIFRIVLSKEFRYIL